MSEQVSSIVEREGDTHSINRMVETMKPGDHLVVDSIVSLKKRSIGDLLALLELMKARGILLVSIQEKIDCRGSQTSFETILEYTRAIKKMESNLFSYRTRVAQEAAKVQGKKGGRRRSITDEMILKGKKLVDGGMSVRKAAVRLNISNVRLSQLLKELNQKEIGETRKKAG